MTNLPPPNLQDSHQPSMARRSKETKKRITLSLPIAIAKKLRESAARTQRTYLEVILEAYEAHASRVLNRANEPSSQFEGLRPIRRRWPQGRVQVALLIHAGDLRVIDASTEEVQLDRSGYVSELIALL